MRSKGWISILLLVAGCAATRSYDFELSGTLNAAAVGDVDGAIKRLQANNARGEKDLLYYFELGMLERLRNQYGESQKAWAAARERIETAEQRTAQDLLRNASSYVISDKVRVYEAHD